MVQGFLKATTQKTQQPIIYGVMQQVQYYKVKDYHVKETWYPCNIAQN